MTLDTSNKGGRPGKLSPIQPNRGKAHSSQHKFEWDATDSLPSDSEILEYPFTSHIDNSNKSGGPCDELMLSGELLSQWMEPGYEMTGDEMNVLSDLLNQLSNTLGQAHVCIPWFYVSGLFTQQGFSIANWRRSKATWTSYCTLNLRDKKVSGIHWC